MSGRRVSVTVDADTKPFSTELARAAAKAAEFRALLDGMDDRVGIRLDVDTDSAALSEFRREMAGLDDGRVRLDVDADSDGLRSFRRDVDDTSSSIDRLSGRLGIARDALVTIGPAAIPIASLAVPAVAGLAAQLGVATAAGATVVLAMQGLGEALSAVEKARLDPTVENIEAARDAMAQLAPEARRFAREFAELRPALEQATIDAAADGFFPGVTRSLDDLETALPRVEGFFNHLGDVAGDIAGDSIESLTSDRWSDFFGYLERSAEPMLRDLVGTAGDVGHALGEMLMANDPLAKDFSGWLRDQARDLDRWASGLDESEGFREFMAYVRENGPEVAETAAAIGGALTDVAVAAAPIGGPALDALQAVAETVSVIADSPIGTPLLQAAAALAIFNRAAAATRAVPAMFAATSANAGAASGAVVGGMGRAATAIGVATGAATMFGNKLAEWTGAKIDVGGVAADLEAMANGARPELLGQVGDSLDYVGESYNHLAEVAREPLSLFGLAGDTSMDMYEQNLRDVDQALVDLIETGKRGQAEKAFQSILEEATGAVPGASIAPWARDDVLESFPGYAAALDAATAGNGKYASSADEAGGAAGNAAQNINEMARAMRGQHDAALAAFDAQTAWGQAVADAREAAAKGERGIQANSEAGRENRAVLSGMASAWNGLGNRVKNNTDRYQSAKRSFIDVATAMTGNERVARKLAQRWLDMPKKVVTKMAVEGERQTRRGLDGMSWSMDKLDRKRARPKVEPETRRGQQELSRFDARMREIGGRRPRPTIDANDRPGRSTIEGMDNRLRQLDGQKTQPKVGADTGEAMKKTGQAYNELSRVGGMRPTPTVGVNDNASGPLSGIRAMMASIQSKTVTVTVQTRQVRANALGGYWPAGASMPLPRHEPLRFATGGMDLPNRHVAEFAGPGPTRVWREEETEGESYIPHANDHRRPGAWQVLEQTANLFGGHVERYGLGGLHPADVHRGAMHVGRGAAGRPTVNVVIDGAKLRGRLDLNTGELKAEMHDSFMRVLDKRDRFDKMRMEASW